MARRGFIRVGAAMMVACLAVGVALQAVPALALDEIWDLEAVNADGTGSHALVGAQDQVWFTGVVLNAPADMLNPNNPSGFSAWQMYVQTLPDGDGNPQHGGIAVFAASPYYAGTGYMWPRYPTDFVAGDVVEVVGYLANNAGKVNLNERHDPYYEFTVTHVQDGGANVNSGLPAPFAIPSIAACNSFDQTRAGGGELYQAQWATLKGVSVTSGTWGDGQQVVIADGSKNPDNSPATLGLLLGYSGTFGTGAACDFSQWPAPGTGGKFNVSAIFDQEDGSAVPWDAGYRMWPLQRSQLQYWGDTDLDNDVDLLDAGTALNHFTGANNPPSKTWAEGNFDGDQDVDLLDVGELLVNWTGAITQSQMTALAMGAAPAGTACGTYDWTTGEIVLSASGIEYLRVDGDGFLTGDAPDWSFLTAGLTDDCDDFTGFWALNNSQTFMDQSIGDVAAMGLVAGDLMLIYQAGLGSAQVSTPLTVVPEPVTLGLMAAGLAALSLGRRGLRGLVRGKWRGGAAAGLISLVLAAACGCGATSGSEKEKGMSGQHQSEAGPQRFEWSGPEGYIPLLTGRPMTCGMRSGRVALQAGETCGEHTTGAHEEFIIVLEGQGQGLAKGREPVALQAGQSLYVPPHTVHNMKNVDAQSFKYIYVVSPIPGEAPSEPHDH